MSLDACTERHHVCVVSAAMRVWKNGNVVSDVGARGIWVLSLKNGKGMVNAT